MDRRNSLLCFLDWLRAFSRKTFTMWITMALRKQPPRRLAPSNKVPVYAQHRWRQSLCGGFVLFTCLMLFAAKALLSETSSPLGFRGYSVLPVPQKVTLTGKDFALYGVWKLELKGEVKEDDVAVESLKASLASRSPLSLFETGSSPLGSGVIQMDLKPKSVLIDQAIDRNKPTLVEQAYRLTLGPRSLKITANAPPGLFYGVQTLIQLIHSRNGRLWLPEGEIVDWPDVELRVIYWDDAHHLEHLEVLKRAVQEAAFFKINGLAIKLEGHFQYKSSPAIIEPYALARSDFTCSLFPTWTRPRTSPSF